MFRVYYDLCLWNRNTSYRVCLPSATINSGSWIFPVNEYYILNVLHPVTDTSRENIKEYYMISMGRSNV